MRQFDYTKKWKKCLRQKSCVTLQQFMNTRGEQRLIAEHHADVLESLVEVAKIQSTESSNKIEGIYTSDECLKKRLFWIRQCQRQEMSVRLQDIGMCLTQYTRISLTFQSVKVRPTDRPMTTPLFLLRCVQLGISIRDLDLLTIGLVNDMYAENSDDDYKGYKKVATQEDFDKF